MWAINWQNAARPRCWRCCGCGCIWTATNTLPKPPPHTHLLVLKPVAAAAAAAVGAVVAVPAPVGSGARSVATGEVTRRALCTHMAGLAPSPLLRAPTCVASASNTTSTATTMPRIFKLLDASGGAECLLGSTHRPFHETPHVPGASELHTWGGEGVQREKWPCFLATSLHFSDSAARPFARWLRTNRRCC